MTFREKFRFWVAQQVSAVIKTLFCVGLRRPRSVVKPPAHFHQLGVRGLRVNPYAQVGGWCNRDISTVMLRSVID